MSVRRILPPALWLGLAGLVLAAPATREVAPGLRLLPGRFMEGEQPDGNTLLLDAPEGLIVVDTGRHPRHTQAIIDLARAEGRPVAAVINTHWHLDHTGGNGRLRQVFPGAPVYGTDAARLAMDGFLTQYRAWLLGEVKRLEADSLARRPLESELEILADSLALLPDSLVTVEGPRQIAGRELRFGLTSHAVTSSDLWIFDPLTRVLIVGDLVTLPAPLLDTACPKGWKRELARLAEVDFTLLVPGHGPPLSRAEFERWRGAFTRLLLDADSEMSRDSCAEGWMRDVAPLIPEADRQLARSLLDYSIDNLLRGDPARLKAICGR